MKQGTLKDVLHHANLPDGRILNGLGFPTPNGCEEPDECLSSDTVASIQTMHLPLCRKYGEIPRKDIRSGLAATKGAITNWHIDNNGFGTYVQVQTGKKWWVVAKEKEENPFSGKRIYSEFDPQVANSHLWEVHAIMLAPGDRL